MSRNPISALAGVGDVAFPTVETGFLCGHFRSYGQFNPDLGKSCRILKSYQIVGWAKGLPVPITESVLQNL
jgi:hypothetical protein